VVDASNPDFPEQMAEVQRVLVEIGASDVPQLLIFNKLDAMPAEKRPLTLHDQYEQDGVVVERLFVSARTGEGLAPLRQSLSERVGRLMPLEKQDDSIPLEIPAQSTDQTP
jgi:GTP-binding protein HflX